MKGLDIFFFAIIILLAIRGAFRGLVKEVSTMASVLAGSFFAIVLYRPLGSFLKSNFGLSIMPDIIGFAVVFLLVWILFKFLSHIIINALEKLQLGGLDKFLGLVFGLIESFILIALICLALKAASPFITSYFDITKILEQSTIAKLITPLIEPHVQWGLEEIKKKDFKLLLPTLHSGKQ